MKRVALIPIGSPAHTYRASHADLRGYQITVTPLPPHAGLGAPPSGLPLAPQATAATYNGLPDLHSIAQAAAQQAVAQALLVHRTAAPTTTTIPAATTATWVYQPPAASAQAIAAMQSSLAAQAAAICLPRPSSPQFAPLSGTIPSIPAKFTAAAAAGEFVELLHAIDAEGGEEPPLVVQVGEDQHLSLPRRHKRRVVSTFGEWSRCFAVYASTLCA